MPHDPLPDAELRACFRQAPASFAVLDRCARIAWASRYVAGHGPDILGTPAPQFIHEEDRDEWLDRFRSCRDLRGKERFRTRVIGPEPPGWVAMDAEMSPVVIEDDVRFVLVVACEVRGRAVPPATPVPALPVRPAGVPAGAKWLSPLAERIVACLAAATSKWTPCDAIAQRIGEPPGHRLKAILSGLVERGIVEASAGAGYRLAADGD